MSGQFILHTQKPTPKERGVGVLSIARNGEAQFFGGDGKRGAAVLAEMQRAQVVYAAANGIAALQKSPVKKARARWVRAKSPSELSVGDVVKALAPTISGWKGYGRVLEVDYCGAGSVTVLKLDKMTGEPEEDRFNTAEFCIDQVAYKASEN